MKQAELQEVVDKLTAMENEYEAKKAKKKELEDNINLCKLKLERAEKLLSGILFHFYSLKQIFKSRYPKSGVIGLYESFK